MARMILLGLLLFTGLVESLPLNQDIPEEIHLAIPAEASDINPEEQSGYFEGDIELQPGDNPLHRNAVADKRRLWSNGVVPYEISSSYPSAVKQIFMQAMHEIEEKTKVNGKTCIKFNPRHGETAYVRFQTGSGCHTPVGWIGRMSGVTIGHGCERKGTVMHELLHALGFWHEQSRSDRDNYVIVHFDNIQSGHSGNFNKYPIGYIDQLGQPYDYGSIMHYGAYAFAKDRNKMTLEPKQRGVIIGQRVRLSDIDIKEIQILYGCVPRGSATSSPGHATAATAAPVTGTPPKGDFCNFQHNLCTWKQSHNDNFNWRRHSHGTSSHNTGPHNDHTGSNKGKYLYLEATSHVNQTARLDSKEYPAGDYCIDFYYHMYGSDMGSLSLNILSGTHIFHLKTWSGNHGNQWYHQRLNVHIHASVNIKQSVSEYYRDIYKPRFSDVGADANEKQVIKRTASESSVNRRHLHSNMYPIEQLAANLQDDIEFYPNDGKMFIID